MAERQGGVVQALDGRRHGRLSLVPGSPVRSNRYRTASRKIDQILRAGFAGRSNSKAMTAKKRGGNLKLVSPNKRVTEVLRHTNLDTIFSVYGNEGESFTVFRKQLA